MGPRIALHLFSRPPPPTRRPPQSQSPSLTQHSHHLSRHPRFGESKPSSVDESQKEGIPRGQKTSTKNRALIRWPRFRKSIGKVLNHKQNNEDLASPDVVGQNPRLEADAPGQITCGHVTPVAGAVVWLGEELTGCKIRYWQFLPAKFVRGRVSERREPRAERGCCGQIDKFLFVGLGLLATS
ncbi:hypothetical protein LY78DRAFT_670177 [Colletotrichum sublineola]|uniref:Uncharacterized protein n=1 Tax=Colletotrichum sublineola TaxID=1173701 RepID=A0A066XDD5_COLSU|nr:hypothetical protein LY78DRAFT_670177 [Colletotrichum sublineola]KDN64045.1 hypothetical protein CSUB01_06415 [Colletotrichum sublineola]